jgi:hypothetical protein
MFTIKFTPTRDPGVPPRKLADAELHFTDAAGPLADLKLMGFSVCELGGLGRYVTFPACQDCIDGEQRSVGLLRPIGDAEAFGPIRDRILDAYAEYERRAAEALEQLRQAGLVETAEGRQDA